MIGSKKKALIIGISGQDGVLLSKLLLKKKYQIFGLAKSKRKKNNLKIVKINKKIHFKKINIRNTKKIVDLIIKFKPNEIYNFSGVTTLKNDKKNKNKNLEENYLSVKKIIKKLIEKKISTKIFISLSSEIYKKNSKKVDENHTLYANNNYALSKIQLLKYIRKILIKNKFFVSCGVFFNHNSFFRDKNYLAKKICEKIEKYKFSGNSFIINSLNNVIDFGYAENHVFAAWKILQQKSPDIYNIGTGKKVSVKQLIIYLLNYYKIKYRFYNKDNKIICTDIDKKKIIFFSKNSKKSPYVLCNNSKINKLINKKNFWKNYKFTLKKILNFK
jgi:GDPmannose 4,6-dehydratase